MSTNQNRTSNNGRVTELDATHGNTCVRQFFHIQSNSAVIRFNWAAREGTPLHTNQFAVRLFGRDIKNICPWDYEVHREEFRIEITPPGRHIIQFCGRGPSDTASVLIDNVSVVSYVNC